MRTHLSRKDISGQIRTVLADESTDREKAMNMDIYTRFSTELGLSALDLSFIAVKLENKFGVKLPDSAVDNMGKYTIHRLSAIIKYELDWGTGRNQI